MAGASSRRSRTRDGRRPLLPANFYRTLRGMLADGLIEEAGPPAPRPSDAGLRGPRE